MRHFTPILGLLLLAPACSESESSYGPPWDSFQVKTVADHIRAFVSEIDPTNPLQGVTFQPDSFGGSQVVYIPNTEAPDTNTCLTCDHSKSPFNFNAEPYYMPDGRHLLFRSDRDRPEGSNPFLIRGGGEIYIMKTDGSDPQRLTFFDGIARVPRVSRDGSRLVWTQVTTDSRMHLVFADLIEKDGQFSLGEVLEVRFLGRDGDPFTALSRSLALVEWKDPSPIGDWWSIFATFGSTMNIDAYALSIEAREARRLTSHPENNETATWDPTGLGMAVQSGQDYYQVRQFFPLPLPTFMDDIMVFLGGILAQTGGAVPWVHDLYYMDATGEAGMTKLVDGSPEGLFSFQSGWIDHETLPFNQIRAGLLSSPDPSHALRRYGLVKFSGRSSNAHMAAGKPAFLDGATLETYPVEIVPFDINDVHPSIESTLPGHKAGKMILSIRDAELNAKTARGQISVRFENFNNSPSLDGDYTLDGSIECDYEIGNDLTRLRFTLGGEVGYTDTEGLGLRVTYDWRIEDLIVKADTISERPGNTERREIRFPLTTFLLGG